MCGRVHMDVFGCACSCGVGDGVAWAWAVATCGMLGCACGIRSMELEDLKGGYLRSVGNRTNIRNTHSSIKPSARSAGFLLFRTDDDSTGSLCLKRGVH